MDQKELFRFYEKQYYHEIEVRDKLNSRMQIPLAVLVTVVGFLGFMFQNINYKADSFPIWIFLIFYFLALISSVYAIYCFSKSLFGHTDKLLPRANESEAYRNELISFYSDYKNKNELVDNAWREYLYNYYVDFSSVNTSNNDSRSYYLYKMTVALIVTTILSFMAFIPYHYQRYDNDQYMEHIPFELMNKLKQELIQMSKDKNPPPPPQPPPARNVKGSEPNTKKPPPQTSNNK